MVGLLPDALLDLLLLVLVDHGIDVWVSLGRAVPLMVLQLAAVPTHVGLVRVDPLSAVEAPRPCLGLSACCSPALSGSTLGEGGKCLLDGLVNPLVLRHVRVDLDLLALLRVRACIFLDAVLLVEPPQITVQLGPIWPILRVVLADDLGCGVLEHEVVMVSVLDVVAEHSEFLQEALAE